MGRTRIRESMLYGTSFNIYGQPATAEYRNMWERTYDMDSFPGDLHRFENTKLSKAGGLLDGVYGDGTWFYTRFSGFPCTISRSGDASHIPIPTPSDAEFVTELIARTTPHRRAIAQNVSLAELREIPGLVRQSYALKMGTMFQNSPKWVRYGKIGALTNVMIQFGIMPLLSDLHKILIFQKYVNQRVKELDRLAGPRGLRRTIELFSESSIDSSEQVFHSGQPWVQGTTSRCTTVKVRGHVRYRPTHAIPTADADRIDYAYKLVSGKDLTVSDLYELLPWSWLIDYFTNLGTYLQTISNTLNLSVEAAIMRQTDTEVVCTPTYVDSGVTMSNLMMRRTDKTRQRAWPGITAKFDALTGRQLSILGSLAILKMR